MPKAAKKKAPAAEAMNVINKRFDPECAIGDIQEHPRNAREGDVGALHVSIDHNGFYGALIVQESTGYILSGNHRYKAAVQKGATHIPVIWVSCDDSAALRIMVADNRTADIASYSNDALAELLESIKIDETGLGFLGTGWDDDSYQNLLADLSGSVLGEESKAGLTEDDAVPEVPAEPVSRLGDLWICGDHRVLCGDSISAKDVDRLMDGGKADLTVTDPPYNVDYEGKTGAKLKIQNDKMSDAGFASFLRDVYKRAAASMNDGAAIYVFYPDRKTRAFHSEFESTGFHLSCVCVWVKQSIVMGRSDYHAQHEPVIYGWKDGSTHKWHGDRSQSTVWQYDRPTKSELHPTMKPVALIERPIGLSSKSGDVVLDLFGGSGSTLIACEKTNRKARLMELDPKYVDVIVQRWQEFTGHPAMLDSDGRTFDEVKANGRAA